MLKKAQEIARNVAHASIISIYRNNKHEYISSFVVQRGANVIVPIVDDYLNIYQNMLKELYNRNASYQETTIIEKNTEDEMMEIAKSIASAAVIAKGNNENGYYADKAIDDYFFIYIYTLKKMIINNEIHVDLWKDEKLNERVLSIIANINEQEIFDIVNSATNASITAVRLLANQHSIGTFYFNVYEYAHKKIELYLEEKKNINKKH